MTSPGRPVRVFYFPRGRRGRTRSSTEIPAATNSSVATVPATSAQLAVGGEETVTEPGAFSAPAEKSDPGAGELTKVAGDPRRDAPSTKGRVIRGGAAAKPQEATPLPVKRSALDLGLVAGNVLPQSRKVEEIIVARDPISALQGLDRTQLNELALVGHKLFEQGKLSQARAVFEALVAVGMTEAFPYTMLGTVYLAQGNPSRALALFEAALRIDAKDIAARVYRGEIKAQTGKHKEALSDFEAVIRHGKKEDPFVQRARQLSRITSDLARKRR